MAWMHYNPHRADPALLDTITGGAARLALLAELTQVLHAEIGRSNHQHQLLIGPRGAGKTHLLRVLVHRLRADTALTAAWWPVVLPEEVGVRGPVDLLARVVDRLAQEMAEAGEAAARTPLLEAQVALKGMRRGEPSLDVANTALARAATALGRTLLVVVENLDGVLYAGPGGARGRAGDEQWALRRVLQSAPHLLLLGAAPTHFGAASDPGAAFHGFFREHLVDGLPTEEVLAILEHRLAIEAAADGDRGRRAAALLARMPERRGKLAGILRLTGGLPRFVHLVVDLLLDSEDGEVGELMDRLLDEQTPLFQSRLDPRLVAPQELEALAELARATGPLRPAELARRVGASSAEAAVLLERLRERGLVRRAGRAGNATTWDVGEPLYRVWMAFREGGEPRSRIEAMAAVVASLWDQGELEQQRAEATEAGDARRSALFDAALRVGVLVEEPVPEPGASERWYIRARERWEREGGVEATLALAEAAAATGREDEAGVRAHEALAVDPTGLQRARALRLTGRFEARGGENATAASYFAEGARLFSDAGEQLYAGYCHLDRSQALRDGGRPDEAAAALLKARRAWGEHLSDHQQAAIALYGGMIRGGDREFAQAAALDPAGVVGAHARFVLGSRGGAAEPQLAEARRTFDTLSVHDKVAECDTLLARSAARSGDLSSAADHWFQAIDAVKGLGIRAVRCTRDLTWLTLRAAAEGDLVLAGRALRVLAAAVSDEDAPDPDAEAALLDAAARLLARRPSVEAYGLLYDACGDLARPRRALLEPFVLAARCLDEPRATVLLEEPEEMRRVVDDVLARVATLKTRADREPGWLTGALGAW